MYTIEEFDKQKTRILKYILYKKRSEGEEKEYYSNYLDMTKMQSEWIKLVRERIRDNMTVTDDSLVDWNFNILVNLSSKETKYW